MSDDKSGKSLAEIYLSCKAALSRYVATFFVRRDIEDTVQEAFLKTLQASRATDIQSPKDYMFRVARNIAINKKRRQRIVYEENLGNLTSLIALEDETASPFDQLYSHDKVRAFDDALAGLSPQCRKVFWMQRIDGLSYKEIARKLGIPVRSVEHNLNKALTRCAEHLAARGFADGEIRKVESIAKARKRQR